jgi:uncharacterized protein
MSAKKSSKKAKARVNTLVAHKAPQLAHLLERANSGKRSDVQQYLNAGGSPNVLVDVEFGGSSKAPLLCSIAGWAHSEAADSIKLLLQAGADTTATCEVAHQKLYTALMMASTKPCASLQALLDGGADPCYQTGDERSTALHVAAANGFLQQCEMLVAASGGRALEIAQTSNGNTPLLTACCNQKSAVVKLLCSLGADASSSNSFGNTALIIAAKLGDVSLLRFLLQQIGVDVNHRKTEGSTALVAAAASGSAAAVRLLIEHGADVHTVNARGHSALTGAVAGGNLKILQLFMQHGLDITARTCLGQTLLMQPCTQTCATSAERVVEFLIQQGLSVRAVDAFKSTALHYIAAQSGAAGTLRLLLAHGADVNARAMPNTTPLHTAAMANEGQNAAVLLAAGADQLLVDNSGATALHLAMLMRKPAATRVLVEHLTAEQLGSIMRAQCVSAVALCRSS